MIDARYSYCIIIVITAFVGAIKSEDAEALVASG